LLYLHIGSMKTGSTTIQKFLRREEENFPYRQLKTFSIGNASRLATAAKTKRSYQYWVEHRQLFSKDQYEALQRDIWNAARSEKETFPNNKFIASSEFIYDQYENDPEAIDYLKQNLVDIFGSVKVIIYLRDQISFLKSYYAQGIQGFSRETHSYSTFMNNIADYEVQWNYAAKVKVWGSIFGAENLRLAVFHKDNFYRGNLLEDFLKRVDIDDYPIENKNSSEKLNTSPTCFQLNLMRTFNHSQYFRKKLKRVYMNKYTQRMGPKDFPRKYDEKILELVDDGNRWLNENFLQEFPQKLPTI